MTNWRTILSWAVRPEFVSFEDLPNYLEPYQVWKDNDPRGKVPYLYVGNDKLSEMQSRYSIYLEGTANVYEVIGTWTSYSPETVKLGKWRPEEGTGNWVWQYCEPYTLVADDWRELLGKESSLKLGWAIQKEYLEVDDRVILTGDIFKASTGLCVPKDTIGVVTKIMSWTDDLVLVRFPDWIYPTNRDFDSEVGDSRGWYIPVKKLRLL